MQDAIIIQGEYSTIRHVPSRKVAQVIVEIPQERMAEWMELFGSPGAGTQVAIARLADPSKSVNAEPKADRGRKNWHQLPPAQQAGIRCNEPEFWRYADVQGADEAVEIVTTDGEVIDAELVEAEAASQTATKANSRELFTTLMKGLRACQSSRELKEWGKAFADDIKKMDKSFANEIRAEYKAELDAMTAYEESEREADQYERSQF